MKDEKDEAAIEQEEKELEEGIKKLEKKEAIRIGKYSFTDGKNHVKVNGKYVFKLKDGRTWCPSRQNR